MRNTFMRAILAMSLATLFFSACASKDVQTEEPVAPEVASEEDLADVSEIPAAAEDPVDQDIGTLEPSDALPTPEPVVDEQTSQAMPEPVLDDVAAPAVAEAAAPVAEGDFEYVVMPGDTLGKIAKRLYGSAKSYRKLAEQNGLANPDKIFPGDRIKYSQSLAVKKFKNGSGQVAKTTQLKRGESLSKLAMRIYGDQQFWRMLWKYNIDSIPDANRVVAGQSVSYIVVEQAITH